MPVSLHFATFASDRADPGLPLVMAHGLLGQGRNFGTLARGFAARRDVYTVDMRNHGDSPWDARMDYPSMAGDLAAFIEAEVDGRCFVFGHSMGGKAAMRLALDAPERVAALIVVDIAPVAYTHSHIDEIDALRGLDLSGISRRSHADAALRDRISDPSMRAFLVQNLRIGGDGASYRSNLDVLADAMATLVGWDDPGGQAYEGPVLFVAGGESPYIRPDHEDAIRASFPHAETVTVPGAGHWIHAERPKEVLTLCENFLSRAEGAGR